MELALAALPGVITSCLLAWLLVRLLDKQNDERTAHRAEVAALGTAYAADVSAIHATHSEQLGALLDAHRQEVANLCQRLQAPEIAVAEHLGQQAPPDPPPVDLEDDLALISEREKALREFAEELAAEH